MKFKLDLPLYVGCNFISTETLVHKPNYIFFSNKEQNINILILSFKNYNLELEYNGMKFNYLIVIKEYKIFYLYISTLSILCIVDHILNINEHSK